MARVQISDEVWTSFRAHLGATPINVALGELVEREVGRQRRRSASTGEEIALALEDAHTVASELQGLIARFEQMARGDRPAPAATRPQTTKPGTDNPQTHLEIQ